jgi:hypothetical protein
MKNQNNDREELKDLLNPIYWQGTAEGSEYSCGIDEDKIDDVWNFVQSYTQKKVEEVKKDLIEKALNIFEKHKDEPMTGNVVILELKNLQSLKEKV